MVTTRTEDFDWIVILVCDNIPNQKFWDGNDWTSDLDKAKIYRRYFEAGEVIWNQVPQDKATHRITSSQIDRYKEYLKTGE